MMIDRAPLREQMARLMQMVETQSAAKPPSEQTALSHNLRIEIERWLISMTPAERARRFTTAEIIALAQLKGKTGTVPAAHTVSQALRSMGFMHCRDWTAAGRNRRYWKLHGGTA